MYDCSDDVLDFHDDEVTLPSEDRTEMRNRRNSNRDRLKRNLKDTEKPSPREFKSQGSYAMKVMTQHPDNDYDIDDGVYFAKEDLVGPRGGEMTALQARQMVRDALDDGSFKKAPECRKNCVRIYYNTGYHVDVPVYRRVTTKDWSGAETIHHELASSDWKRSDARDVTKWFDEQCSTLSVDSISGGQVRRLTRDIKKFARSRASWGSQILSGFGITKLVTECYKGDAAREDRSLYDTMKAIRDRLTSDLVVKHPITPGETITKETEDPKSRFLRDKLSDALTWLDPLFKPECIREEALKAWDKTFDTKYFIDRLEDEKDDLKAAATVPPSILSSGLLRAGEADESVRKAVNKQGGGRYA